MKKDNETDTKPGRRRSRLFRIYRVSSGLVGTLAVAYFLLLCFPQVLFATSVNYGHFTVYTRAAPGPGLEKVLDDAETRLLRSPIYDDKVSRSVFLTDSSALYALLSHKAYNSFGNTVPLINNIIINRSDAGRDLVFMNRPEHNSRSLSGVIAHEVTHLLIRKKYGEFAGMTMPTWKNEGYCEYIAGDTTIPFEEGIRLWRENPADDAGYRFVKYQAMVRFLLETEKMSVDDLFARDLDQKEIEARTFASLE